tara:strand:+ start:1066 stop:1590 length:525 start_codon:yes stop_codon:yes gene_type:complete
MIAENVENINTNHIIICDPIKNSVMQYSNFYKIVYSNELISLNGLYILFNLHNINQNKEKILFNYSDNKIHIDKISEIENYILNLIYSNKNKVHKISELLNNGFIKYCYNDSSINNINYNNNKYSNKSLILKISGLWETKENIGVTFKIILVEDTISFVQNNKTESKMKLLDIS